MKNLTSIYSFLLLCLFLVAHIPVGLGQDASEQSALYQEVSETYAGMEGLPNDTVSQYLLAKLEEATAVNDDPATRFISIKYGEEMVNARNREEVERMKDLCTEVSGRLGQSTARCNNLLGMYYRNVQELERAEPIFHQVIEDCLQTGDTSLLIITYNELAIICDVTNRNGEATDMYLKAIDLSKALKDSVGIAKTYYNLAVLFQRSQNWEKALFYLDETDQYFSSTQPKEEVYFLSKLLRDAIYGVLGKTQQALEGYVEILKESKDAGQLKIYMFACLNYADLNIRLKDFKEAEIYLLEGLELAKDKQSLFYFNSKLGQLYLGMEKCQQAYDHVSKAKSYLSAKSDYEWHRDLQMFRIKAIACLGKTDSIGGALDEFMTYQDSFYKEKNNELVIETETKYRSQIQADSLQLLNLKYINQASSLRQRNILVIGICMLVLLLGYVLYLNRKRFQSEKAMNEMLIENDKQKSKLFSNIAHELQTPLSIIVGFASKILDRKESKIDVDDAAMMIQRNAGNLTEITKQILSLSKIDKVQLKPVSKTFKIRDLVNHIVEGYRPAAEAKSVRLSVASQLTDDQLIFTDPDKMVTVLKNLVSNAIKYNDPGGEIILHYDKRGDSHRFQIKDNGRGIAKEDLPNIFDRYFQSKNTKPEGGVGLGLAICKEYIELLNGQINVESVTGLGTNFSIDLPCKSDRQNENNLYRFPSTGFVVNGFTDVSTSGLSRNSITDILIVEDNLDFCKYLETVLGAAYQLHFEHDGAAAIDYLAKHKPELIITDWMMPNKDGLELVQHLKAEEAEATKDIPVLMITARSLSTDQLRALRVGVDDYLLKPFNEEELFKRIEVLLDNRELVEKESVEKAISNVTLNAESSSTSKKQPFDQDWLLQLETTISPLIDEFDLNIAKIAQLMNIHPWQLKLKVQELTGFTVGKYVRELRLWEARRMLEEGDYGSVKAVSLSVGFKDTKYFSRIFKNRFGKNPSEFLVRV